MFAVCAFCCIWFSYLEHTFFPHKTTSIQPENKQKIWCLIYRQEKYLCIWISICKASISKPWWQIRNWGVGGGWQYMILPNMVNKTSTVLMTFFKGCNPADRKFERHGRSPNKAVVGGAKGHWIWLAHILNFSLQWCPIVKGSLRTGMLV